MPNRLKKTIVITLLVTMVFSTSFFVQPKKADAAAASCLISALGTLIGGLGGALSGIMSVPVADRSTETNTGTGAAAGVGSNLGQCLLTVLARVAAQTIIHSFTQSTLKWINSGFHGSPSFVTNPEGFLSNVGDIAAGQFIQGLGPVGQILCSPFDLNLRVALGLSLGAGGTGRGTQYQYVGCKLSDVQKNIYNSFVGGKWGAQGWQNFISISQGSGNFYGAYLYGKDAMSQQIASKVGLKQNELQMGNGFLNQEQCYDNYDGSEINPNEADASGYFDYSCETVTPGSVIQDQLNKTLGIPTGVLSVSQDIDDILNALVNQGITQVFSATGLTGVTKPSALYGGHTYLSTMTATYQSQLAAGQTLPPSGIECSKTYRVITSGAVPTVQVLDPTTNTWQPTAITIGTQTPAQFQNQITVGCQNLAAAAPAQEAINGMGGAGGNLSGGNQAVNTCDSATNQIKNLAEGAPIYSRTAPDGGWASLDVVVNGVFGTSFSGNGDNYETSLLTGGNYFQITLPNLSDIKYLAIGPLHSSDKFNDGMGGTQIYFYNSATPPAPDVFYNSDGSVNHFTFHTTAADGFIKIVTVDVYKNQIDTPTGIIYDGYDPFYIGYNLQTIVATKMNTSSNQFSDLKNVKSILVYRPYAGLSGNDLYITEFQAWGYDSTNSGGAGCGSATGAPTQSAAAITSQNVSNISIYQGNSFNNNGNLTIASSQNLPDLNVQTSLVQVVGTATSSVAMDSVFNTFGESRSIIYGQSNPEIIFPRVSADNPTQTPSDPGYNISLVASAPTSLINGTTAQTYYLKIGGTLLPNAPLGTYQLVVNVTESGTGLSVGTQTYTFTVISSTQ